MSVVVTCRFVDQDAIGWVIKGVAKVLVRAPFINTEYLILTVFGRIDNLDYLKSKKVPSPSFFTFEEIYNYCGYISISWSLTLLCVC